MCGDKGDPEGKAVQRLFMVVNVYASPSLLLLGKSAWLRTTVTSFTCFGMKSCDQYLPRKCEKK